MTKEATERPVGNHCHFDFGKEMVSDGVEQTARTLRTAERTWAHQLRRWSMAAGSQCCFFGSLLHARLVEVDEFGAPVACQEEEEREECCHQDLGLSHHPLFDHLC